MLVLPSLVQSLCLVIQLVLRLVPGFNFFSGDRRGRSDCTFLLKFRDKLLSPFLGHILLGFLHVVAVSIWEIVETISFVILPLHLSVHMLFCDTRLDVLTILFL